MRVRPWPRRRTSTGATQASVGSNSAAHSSRRLLQQTRGDGVAHGVPAAAVVLASDEGGVERQQPGELGEELRLQAGDGDVAAVGGLVGVVEGRAGIEQVGAAPILQRPGGHEGEERRASIEAPSIIAASTTWPLPERERSKRAASRPAIRNIVPPP